VCQGLFLKRTGIRWPTSRAQSLDLIVLPRGVNFDKSLVCLCRLMAGHGCVGNNGYDPSMIV
jgi:hypothetical protein